MTDYDIARYALRTFDLKNGHLGSVYQTCHWTHGVMVATCRKRHGTTPHKATYPHTPCDPCPGEDCVCGVYGTLTLEHLFNQWPRCTSRCVAVIAPEGRGFLGDKGLRAAAARIVAYWCAPSPPDDDDDSNSYWRSWCPCMTCAEDRSIKDPQQIFARDAPAAQAFTELPALLEAYHFPTEEGTGMVVRAYDPWPWRAQPPSVYFQPPGVHRG